jgi:hypothetical protein
MFRPRSAFFRNSTRTIKYLITLWSTVYHEKLTGSQLVRKFPACYGNGNFITVCDII